MEGIKGCSEYPPCPPPGERPWGRLCTCEPGQAQLERQQVWAAFWEGACARRCGCSEGGNVTVRWVVGSACARARVHARAHARLCGGDRRSAIDLTEEHLCRAFRQMEPHEHRQSTARERKTSIRHAAEACPLEACKIGCRSRPLLENARKFFLVHRSGEV